jgi:signal transduction histidine kinase
MIAGSMNLSSRGTPHIYEPEPATSPNATSVGDSTSTRAVLADAHPATVVDARQRRHQSGGVWRPERTTRDGLIEALTALSGRCRALTDPNRELASEVTQLRADLRQLRSRVAAASNIQPVTSQRARAHTYFAGDDERRSLERDLHDGVQNELVSIIVRLQLAQDDRDTSPELVGTLSALSAHAQAALDSVREIARGIYPSSLAVFGVQRALRTQAARASLDVRLEGTAPRSTENAEAAVYFSCLEAIQNAAKHAGRGAHVTVQLQYDHGTLAVRVEDDGQGFDPPQTPVSAGLRNIHDRIETLGGTVELASSPGGGTLLAISLPWPARQPRTGAIDQRS